MYFFCECDATKEGLKTAKEDLKTAKKFDGTARPRPLTNPDTPIMTVLVPSQPSFQIHRAINPFHAPVSSALPAPTPPPPPAPFYKSAGGILHHRTKFGEDRYALVKGHRHQKWSFPKGHIQEKETTYVCALREIAEETGIDLLPRPLTSCQIGFGYYYFFEVEEEYPLHPRDKEEIMETKWLTIEEMRHLSLNTDVTKFVQLSF